MAEIETDASIPEANRPGAHENASPDKPQVSPSTWSIVKGEAHLYPYAFDSIAGRAARLFGVSDDHGLTLGGGRLQVRYGPWVLDTPATNLTSVAITGPYHLWKVLGPPHLSLADRGITFATNSTEGLCMRFAEPVPAIGPMGLVRHPGATVTVADVEHLEEMLTRYLEER
jgi:hypothetical protein